MKLYLLLMFFISTFAIANHHVSSIHIKELNSERSDGIIDFQNAKNPSVIIFISKDCPCSKSNLSYINKLSTDFKDYNFIGIHSKKDTKDSELISYLSDKNLNFKTYNDPDLKIADDFKALKTPHAFIVNTNGDIIYSGGVASSVSPENAKTHFLRDALNEYAKTKAVATPETKTLGCYITR